MAITVFYDGDCPFCRQYVRYIRLQETVGPVRLEDLRQNCALQQQLQRQGFNLDEGMVVQFEGRYLGGADAVNTLALLSTPAGVFNRMNRLLLSSLSISKLVYPVLRAGRWLALFLLGRPGFASGDKGIASRAVIFAQFFALFSIFHFFNYALEYGRFPPGLDQVALFISALALLFRPRSARLLLLLMLISTISTIVQAPVQSNHTLVRSALLLGYWLSFAMAWLKGSDRDSVFVRFAPAGQGALLVMYFFGIFHKINADFLNPVTSCAVALWRQMPAPLTLLDGPIVETATIYGTFFVEGALMVLLLTPRLRHVGICCGILFHMLLALSGYAMYLTFTMLSITMHSLFIGNSGALAIVQSPEMRVVRARLKDPLYIIAMVILLGLLILSALRGAFPLVTLLMLPVVLPFCWVVFRYGRSGMQAANESVPAGSNTVGVIVAVLLFANCLMPYFGLKSAQAINMFANLRLEEGISNHLIMPPPRPFGYLEQVALIEDGGKDGVLQSYADNGYAIVYYDLLSMLEAQPDNRVTFTYEGRRYESVGADDFSAEIDSVLHPRWFRKWFHFQPVVLAQPEACNV